jgi:hypothetical protein
MNFHFEFENLTRLLHVKLRLIYARLSSNFGTGLFNIFGDIRLIYARFLGLVYAGLLEI